MVLAIIASGLVFLYNRPSLGFIYYSTSILVRLAASFIGRAVVIAEDLP
jgi:hypothetical protein